MTSPLSHEIWCAEWGYGVCNCDFDKRQALYECFGPEHRLSDAAKLPRARVVKKLKP